jgi:hypothetical protein
MNRSAASRRLPQDEADSLESFLSAYPSERDHTIRPFELWPLLAVVAIAAFLVWASDGSAPPDQHMSSPYMQARMAP